MAHAHLTRAAPPIEGSVAAAPDVLRLEFTEAVNPAFSGVTITGADPKAIALGRPRLGPEGRTVLVVPVTSTLAPGAYTVRWHALAEDGHKTQGAYSFTIKP